MCRQCYVLQTQKGQCGGRKLKRYSSPETHNQLKGTPAPAHRHSVHSAPVQPHQQWKSVSASPHCSEQTEHFTFCTLVNCASEHWIQIFGKLLNTHDILKLLAVLTSGWADTEFWKEWRGHMLLVLIMSHQFSKRVWVFISWSLHSDRMDVILSFVWI